MASGALSSTPGPANPTAQSPQPSWEGDKMFNIYIYDYCTKRGFRETAEKLRVEAEIAPDSAPPINAKQGLLFEWWSVFWVLFTAKSSGSGTDDAMLYIQQQQTQAQRQAQARMQPQQPPQMARFMNGMQRQSGGMLPNGPMPNGVGPASLQSAQGPMSNGNPGPMSFPMGGSGPHQNGIPGTANGPSGSSLQQQPGFQSMMSGQRPGGPQQRGPHNGPQFQSPTIAHSPQNPGAVPGQQPPPMGQLGPSPHMSHMQRSGNMLPPNGAQAMQQAPNPSFQQVQRPPSRTASPSNMTQPSPSMTARQPPVNTPISAQEAALNNELARAPTEILTSLRQELGLGNRDLGSLSLDEKQRLLSMIRQRSAKPGGPPNVNNATAGPSVPIQNQRNQQRQAAPQQQPRGNKRASTSPAEEHETLPRNETSSPDRKRTRRSPLNAEQATTMNSMNYTQPSPQGGQGGAQPMSNGMMRNMGASGMNGFPQGGMQNMGNNMPMGQPMGAPQMGSSQPMMTQQQMVQYQQQQQQQQQYRQSMRDLHKMNAGSPTSGDGSFNVGGPQGRVAQFAGNGAPDHRMNQNKAMGMMPPPSPAIGAPKDQSGQGKDKGGPSTSNNRPEGSPRNQNPNPAQGTSNAGNSGQGSTAPPTPNNVMTAPSPSAILVNTPTGMNPSNQSMAPPSDPMSIFGDPDFITSLDPFTDPTGKGAFDVDFERDFGQWFNPENDSAGVLDQK